MPVKFLTTHDVKDAIQSDIKADTDRWRVYSKKKHKALRHWYRLLTGPRRGDYFLGKSKLESVMVEGDIAVCCAAYRGNPAQKYHTYSMGKRWNNPHAKKYRRDYYELVNGTAKVINESQAVSEAYPFPAVTHDYALIPDTGRRTAKVKRLVDAFTSILMRDEVTADDTSPYAKVPTRGALFDGMGFGLAEYTRRVTNYVWTKIGPGTAGSEGQYYPVPKVKRVRLDHPYSDPEDKRNALPTAPEGRPSGGISFDTLRPVENTVISRLERQRWPN